MAVPTELWTASGSAPFTKWTNATKLRRTYDADVRGYVVELPPVTAGAPKPSLNGAHSSRCACTGLTSTRPSTHTPPLCLPALTQWRCHTRCWCCSFGRLWARRCHWS